MTSYHLHHLIIRIQNKILIYRCFELYATNSNNWAHLHTKSGILKKITNATALANDLFQVSHFSRLTKFHISMIFPGFLKVNFQVFFHYFKILFPSTLNINMCHGLSLLEMHSGGNDQRPRCRPTSLGVLGAW